MVAIIVVFHHMIHVLAVQYQEWVGTLGACPLYICFEVSAGIAHQVSKCQSAWLGVGLGWDSYFLI